MKTLKINQERYDKLVHEYPKIIEQLNVAVKKAEAFLWDFRMLIEKDKEEEEKKEEFNG